MDTLAHLTTAERAEAPLDVAAVHAAHKHFVWATLQRLGVRPADREDLFQETFIVVHKRLHTFDARSPLLPWLFGICKRVVANHRRLAHVRREQAVAAVPEPSSNHGHLDPPHDAEAAVARRQAYERLEEILGELDLDKRAVFVMFELEGVSCDEIAALVGVPVGTIYSRLSSARKDFEAALRRRRARDAHGTGGGSP